MAVKAKLISKISTRTVAGKQRRLNDNQTERWLFDVAGVANSKRQGESDYGPWTALTGNFMARNIETGETFRSGQCFLPNMALNSVLGVLDGGATGVQLAFRIGIKEGESQEGKYEYMCEPLLDIAEDDPALTLLNKASKPVQIGKGKSKEIAA